MPAALSKGSNNGTKTRLFIEHLIALNHYTKNFTITINKDPPLKTYEDIARAHRGNVHSYSISQPELNARGRAQARVQLIVDYTIEHIRHKEAVFEFLGQLFKFTNPELQWIRNEATRRYEENLRKLFHGAATKATIEGTIKGPTITKKCCWRTRCTEVFVCLVHGEKTTMLDARLRPYPCEQATWTSLRHIGVFSIHWVRLTRWISRVLGAGWLVGNLGCGTERERRNTIILFMKLSKYEGYLYSACMYMDIKDDTIFTQLTLKLQIAFSNSTS